MKPDREYRRHSRHVTRGQRWQALRHAVLERCGWACVKCGARGRLEVDHVQPVRLRPDLAYDPANLQALCATCHTKKTRIEVGHPPPSKERQKWLNSVSALMRGGRLKPKHNGVDDA